MCKNKLYQDNPFLSLVKIKIFFFNMNVFGVTQMCFECALFFINRHTQFRLTCFPTQKRIPLISLSEVKVVSKDVQNDTFENDYFSQH